MDETVQWPATPPVSPAPQEQLPQTPSCISYGKKNWKKWILIYAVIALLVYGAVYYFFLSKKSPNPYTPPTNYPSITTSPSSTTTSSTGNLYEDIRRRLNEVIK